MDFSTTRTMAATEFANEEIAVRQRLSTFKLGKCAPPLSADVSGAPRPGHRHQRSHSRNASISSSSSHTHSLSSLGSSRFSGFQDLSNFSFGGLNSASSTDSCSSTNSPVVHSAPLVGGFVLPSTKRNSHHRRRSSVSTRHESAEMMGVSLPDLPHSLSADNINLGDKDSIRRRALWALEGKSEVPFSKVEIPELSTPDIEKMMFDFSTKSSGSSTGLSFGNPMMGNKRDSFKLLPSSGSSKDQLHTLVEEEEEEEELVVESPKEMLPSPAGSVEEPGNGITAVASIPTTQFAPAKPRPATLNLRPLSLVAGSAVQGLPTPTLTPSPRAGLRSLSLGPSPSTSTEDDASLVKQSRRESINFSRRPRLDVHTDSIDSTSTTDDSKSNRRSSISYKSSANALINAAGLPTPEMTPTFSRQFSFSDRSEEEFFLGSQPSAPKPLSASEQHFLLKSHNALVARITDLEKALSRRTSMGGYSNGSRPSSALSDVTSFSEVPGEPTDEMISFIRDLKTERDELKKDVQGWRTRVSDLERQQAILAKRVETERWEAWAARSRVGILEAEKGALEKRVENLDEALATLEADNKALQNQNQDLISQNEAKTEQMQRLEAELAQLKEELERERKRSPDVNATPIPQPASSSVNLGLGLGPPELGGSFADQSYDIPVFSFTVHEDDEDFYSDDDKDGLDGYEDEGDYDEEFDASSSFDSMDDAPPPIPERPTDESGDGVALSRWSFPKVQPGQATNRVESQNIDRFFGCLDESDTSDDSDPASPVSFNYEQSKDVFASGFRFADEDDAPFFFPPGIGTIVEEPVMNKGTINEGTLSAVEEEEGEDDDDSYDLTREEDDSDMFGEAGGITITFTPPDDVEELGSEVQQIKLVQPAKSASPPPTLPALDFGDVDDDEGEEMFNLTSTAPEPGKSSTRIPTRSTSTPQVFSVPKSIPPVSPPSSIPRSTSPNFTSPSSIPRPSSRQSNNKARETPLSPSPPRLSLGSFNSFATPPSKRGGGLPSFIPQPTASPSPSRVQYSKPRTSVATPTFIRPPSRKSSGTVPHAQSVLRFSNGSSFAQPTVKQQEEMTMNDRSSFEHHSRMAEGQRVNPTSQVMMKSIDLGHCKPSPSNDRAYPFETSQNTTSSLTSLITTPLSSRLLSRVLPWSWSSSAPAPLASRQPSYVSREKQLQRLQRRLPQEVAELAHIHCGRCDDNTIVVL
ncbi:hypothetical protein FA15DRAFT_752789 [Coprinopsis marcescibilis]|uniref:Uncharacterized protein n=1 Tax=Coprinopsis marcescibilis TaxID=230819 RepID=A0A5C3LKY9_COPMA|nr:hypothetical protein FA15DRAFT_752789 [Coprinopsis marcescibilis]